jgi:predicted DCC family thiol-disulfide oxidoreductase YuxK
MPDETAARPTLLFDGDCGFCRRFVERWRAELGGLVEMAPYQEAGARFPEVAPDELAQAIHLVEPNGWVSRGAEAVFRALSYAPASTARAWLAAYRVVPGCASASGAV